MARATSPSAASFLPTKSTLSSLRRAAATCEGCELFRRATQVVFGEGRSTAELMLVGEQPGDREDLSGSPFVGPAGLLLRELLKECGLATRQFYLTNAVKHFHWEERGRRRLHAKPLMRHLQACRPWLDEEVKVLKPRLILCLGVTAAQTCIARGYRVSARHGHVVASAWSIPAIATFHPSAVLRAGSTENRAKLRALILGDLTKAVKFIAAAKKV